MINIFVLNVILELIHMDFFSMSDGSGIAENVMIFGAEKRKNLILDKDPTQGLHDTTLTAEAEYFIDFGKQGRKFCLCLHYDGSNCYLFGNGVKIYQFKTKDTELNAYPLCLQNILKIFAVDERNWTI